MEQDGSRYVHHNMDVSGVGDDFSMSCIPKPSTLSKVQSQSSLAEIADLVDDASLKIKYRALHNDQTIF